MTDVIVRMFRITRKLPPSDRDYYLAYDGRRAVFGAKVDAAVVDEDLARMVLKQLSMLGYKGCALVRAEVDRVREKDCEK